MCFKQPFENFLFRFLQLPEPSSPPRPQVWPSARDLGWASSLRVSSSSMRPLGLWRWGCCQGSQTQAVGRHPGGGWPVSRVWAGNGKRAGRLLWGWKEAGEHLHSSILSCAWAWQPEGPLHEDVLGRMPWNQAQGEPSGQGESEEPGQGDKGRLICRKPSQVGRPSHCHRTMPVPIYSKPVND